MTEFVLSQEEEDSESSCLLVELLSQVLLSLQRKSQQVPESDNTVQHDITFIASESYVKITYVINNECLDICVCRSHVVTSSKVF